MESMVSMGSMERVLQNVLVLIVAVQLTVVLVQSVHVRAHLAHKDRQDRQDRKDRRAKEVTEVAKDQMGMTVREDQEDSPGPQEIQEVKVHRDKPDLVGPLEIQDLQDLQDHRDLLVLQEVQQAD